jgi:hypothetical protein
LFWPTKRAGKALAWGLTPTRFRFILIVLLFAKINLKK